MGSIIETARGEFLRFLSFGFGASSKHDYYRDFGWPENLDFARLHRMYARNGLAAAAVDKTVAKTWETAPALWEVEEKPETTPLEADVAKWFKRRRIWQSLMNVDRRSLVGRYAGAILLLADGKALNQPVDFVPGGLRGLTGVIAAWEGQLRVAEWDADPFSPTYGQPLMYQYNETAVGDVTGAERQAMIHPDRVIIWSEDGTVHCSSALEPGFNDLSDAEKVKGAGGEGFWKTSRGAPIITAPQGMSFTDVQKAMGGATPEATRDKLNEKLDDFQGGFDKGLMLGGMNATPLTINLPKPAEFFDVAVKGFAASFQIPMRILLGNENGERSSTEDAREWAQVNMARRVNYVMPLLEELVDRLVRWRILPEVDWVIGWESLLDTTPDQKLERAAKMQVINKDGGAERPFTPDEIREVAGYQPLTLDDYSRSDGEDEEVTE